MGDDRCGAIVAGGDEVGLGVEEVPGDAAAEVHAEGLLLDASFAETDGEFTVRVVSAGLVQSAPVGGDLEADLFDLEGELPLGACLGDHGTPVGVAFRLPVEWQVHVEAGIPLIVAGVGKLEAVVAVASDACATPDVELGPESVPGNLDATGGILDTIAAVLEIETQGLGNFESDVRRDLWVLNAKVLKFSVVEDDRGVERDAQGDLETVERIPVGADCFDPACFRGEAGLAELVEGCEGAKAFCGECLFPFDVLAGALEVRPGIPCGVTILEDPVIGGSGLDGEVLPVLGEFAERVEEAAFGGGEILQGYCIPAAAEQRDDNGATEFGSDDAAVAGEVAEEIGRERSGQAGAAGEELGGTEAAGAPDEG